MGEDKADLVIVEMPTIEEKKARLGPDEFIAYTIAQGVMRAAIQKLGIEMGISMTLSGVCRELRRHLTNEGIQSALRGYADTNPNARQYDDDSPSGATH